MADFSGIPTSNPMPTLSGTDAVADGLKVAQWSARGGFAINAIKAVLDNEQATNDLKATSTGSVAQAAHDARVA